MKLFKKLFTFFWDKSLLLFLIIGGLNTVFSGLAIWLLMSFAHWGQFGASALVFAVFSVPSFYFNRKYSFESKEPLGPSVLRFAVIITVCFLLSFAANYIAMPWMHENWFPNINPLLYNFIKVVGVQVVFTLLNYLGQRLWAFKKPAPAEKAAPPEE